MPPCDSVSSLITHTYTEHSEDSQFATNINTLLHGHFNNISLFRNLIFHFNPILSEKPAKQMGYNYSLK